MAFLGVEAVPYDLEPPSFSAEPSWKIAT